MKQKSTKCIETYLKSYESRLRNNNLDLHMILYSCNHCFEFNPYSKEIRPFNSIFWYNLDEGENENKYYSILKYLEIKHDIAKDTYPYNFLSDSIGIIMDNTLAVDLNKLIEDIIPNDSSIPEILRKSNIISECNSLIQNMEEMYSNWRDIMMFVLDNYDQIDKISVNNWRN
jgi:hypothetical protein